VKVRVVSGKGDSHVVWGPLFCFFGC